MRVCAEPSCPNVQPEARCLDHRRAYERGRGTRQQRGYDAAHIRIRASYQQRMDAGEVFACWRCGKPIDPNAWDLGHADNDRTKYRGPECRKCNRGTAARR